MAWHKSVAEGDSAETRFVIDYLKKMGRPSVIAFADAYQNMKEHWDLSIDDMRIDVKARRRVSRSGEYTDNVVIFELLNVHGNDGWGKGKSDAIAYETDSEWMIVDRARLLEHCLHTCVDVYSQEPLSKYDGPYKPYSRSGRNDLFTWIPVSDISSFVLIRIPKQ